MLPCWLIPLDKSPSVRPIRVGEILRRIIGKAVTCIVKKNTMDSLSDIAMCVCWSKVVQWDCHSHLEKSLQTWGNRSCYFSECSKYFNNIKRKVLSHNIKILCPFVSTYVLNCNSILASVFIVGGKLLLSQEGTTQGDPLAVAI